MLLYLFSWLLFLNLYTYLWYWLIICHTLKLIWRWLCKIDLIFIITFLVLFCYFNISTFFRYSTLVILNFKFSMVPDWLLIYFNMLIIHQLIAIIQPYWLPRWMHIIWFIWFFGRFWWGFINICMFFVIWCIFGEFYSICIMFREGL